jgi:uncharacterized membrane protein
MEWLNDLLGVEAPPGTVLRSAELGFRGQFPWVVALLLILALAGASFALYFTERGKLGPVRRGFLATVRSLALALLVLLLLRPLLYSEFEGERPRPVFVLLDNSQSMKQQDRRISSEDKLRVAIAQAKLPPDSKIAASPVLPPGVKDLKEIKDVSRADLVRAVLENPQLDLLARLGKHGPVRPYYFGPGLKGVQKESEKGKLLESLLASYDAHEPQTALADAISAVLQRREGDLPAAIVVMTDGRDNASKITLDEAAAECKRLGVPLHIYGTGSADAGSLQIKDVVVADTIFFDDAVAVPVRWRAQGFKKGTVVVSLELDGKEVAKKEVPVKVGEDLRETLTFTPPKGKERESNLNLVAKISLKENPKDFKDEFPRPLRVIDSKVKVLYLEYAPRWEFKFLQPALMRDRRIDAKFVLVTADKESIKPPGTLTPEQRAAWPYLQAFPTREQILEYDVVILGDMPSAPQKGLTKEQNEFLLTKERMEWLKEFVEKFRGGLLVMAGRQHNPSAYVGTPLADILPVEFLPVKFTLDSEKRPEPFNPTLTEAGLRTNMLALADVPEENTKAWAKLPGFYWHYPVTKLKPGSTSLLAHPKAKIGEQPMPLLSTHFYGKGQVLFMGSDETWRWRFNEQDTIFGRFWGQLIYQVGLPHMLGNNSSKVQLALERSEAIVGRPGQLYARLWDKNFQPLKDKKVTAKLVALDKQGPERERPLVLEPAPGQEGEYRVTLPHDVPGRYEIQMSSPEKAVFPYRVNVPPRHELEEAPMNDEVLRRAAQTSGGAFYLEEDLYHLPTNVKPNKEKFTLRQEVILWNWLTFLLFVGLVTTEWVVRKFSNLS